MRHVLGAGALGRPRGMGWEGRRERGSGWGTHVNPGLIHVNVWQKPLHYGKVISFQLIKVKEKLHIYNTKFSTLTILRAQSRGISYIQSVVPPSPLSIFKALSSPQAEIPEPVSSNSPFFLPHPC